MLCLHTDGADVTRATVAGKIEDATGSELLSKLYEKGMSTADIVAQTLATGGASSFGSLGKGLIAVAKSFGDDFLRTFIKTYGDDAVRALLMRDIKTTALKNIKAAVFHAWAIRLRLSCSDIGYCRKRAAALTISIKETIAVC